MKTNKHIDDDIHRYMQAYTYLKLVVSFLSSVVVVVVGVVVGGGSGWR